MPVNQNNFLRFVGSSTPNPYTITGGVVPVFLYANEESVNATIFDFLAASNGIDFSSFTIVNVSTTLSSPPIYDSETEILTCFRPIDNTLTYYVITFTYSDFLGNKSLPIDLIVNISPIVTAWEPYPLSSVCNLDSFGNNNGYQSWSQLVKFNTGSGAWIIPLTLKPNIIADGDYIPPVQNLSLCPAPGIGAYNNLYITNFMKNVISDPFCTISIISISLYSSTILTGGSPTTINIDISLSPIQYGQTRRFNIPQGIYQSVSINYIVNGTFTGASNLHYWTQNNAGVISGFGNGGVGVTDNIITNISPILLNVSPFLTVGSSSSGVTIMAQ